MWLDGNKSFRPTVFAQFLKDLIKGTSISTDAVDWEEQTSRFISITVLLLIQASYGFNLERVCYRHSYLECHVSDMTLHTRSCALQSSHTLKDQCNNHQKWSELRQLRSSKGNATWLWFDSSAIDTTKPLSKKKGRHRGPPTASLHVGVLAHRCDYKSHSHRLTVPHLLLSDMYISFKRYFQRVQGIHFGTVYDWLEWFFMTTEVDIKGVITQKKLTQDWVEPS